MIATPEEASKTLGRGSWTLKTEGEDRDVDRWSKPDSNRYWNAQKEAKDIEGEAVEIGLEDLVDRTEEAVIEEYPISLEPLDFHPDLLEDLPSPFSATMSPCGSGSYADLFGGKAKAPTEETVKQQPKNKPPAQAVREGDQVVATDTIADNSDAAADTAASKSDAAADTATNKSNATADSAADKSDVVADTAADKSKDGAVDTAADKSKDAVTDTATVKPKDTAADKSKDADADRPNVAVADNPMLLPRTVLGMLPLATLLPVSVVPSKMWWILQRTLGLLASWIPWAISLFTLLMLSWLTLLRILTSLHQLLWVNLIPQMWTRWCRKRLVRR